MKIFVLPIDKYAFLPLTTLGIAVALTVGRHAGLDPASIRFLRSYFKKMDSGSRPE
jgi:hypothetical protein